MNIPVTALCFIKTILTNFLFYTVFLSSCAMSARLPLQSKAARPRFERKKAVFGGDDDDERVEDEFVVGIEDNQIKE